MEIEFYIIKGRIKKGPFTIQKIKCKNIKKDTLVWKEGFKGWKKAEEVDELKCFIETKIPDPPTLTHSRIEEIFESILFESRFLILIPVLGIFIASIVVFFKGCVEIVQGCWSFVTSFTGFQFNSTDDNGVILHFIPALDNYLFAIVLLIISSGLYELFISEIDPICRTNKTPPKWLSILSWDELKTHIGEVIIMILIVNFFKWSYNFIYKDSIDLLILAGSIILVAIALVVTHFVSYKFMKSTLYSKKNNSGKDTEETSF